MGFHQGVIAHLEGSRKTLPGQGQQHCYPIFAKQQIHVHIKPINTLKEMLGHPKYNPPPKEKRKTKQRNNVVYTVQCSEE